MPTKRYTSGIRTTEDFRAFVEMHRKTNNFKSWGEALIDLAEIGARAKYGFTVNGKLPWGGKRHEGKMQPKPGYLTRQSSDEDIAEADAALSEGEEHIIEPLFDPNDLADNEHYKTG